MSTVQEKLSEVEAEAAKLEADLAVKRAVIAALRSVAGSPEPSKPTGLRRPAEAVRELVLANPGGIALLEIADQLERVIKTESNTPRRIIQNTVNQLATAGHIDVYEKGGKKFARPPKAK